MTIEGALEENRVLGQMNRGPLLWNLRTRSGEVMLKISR
jgi:hypothetical protein